MGTAAQAPGQLRTAELIASVCLATDLGMGFPFEHGLQATLMTTRLCELLGVGSDTASQAYYASMLIYSGCTADADRGIEIFGGPQTVNVVPVLHGSVRERIGGLLQALPSPDAHGVGRTMEIARRLPRLVAAARSHQEALCEVGEMLARRLGLPGPTQRLFVHLTERWDGSGMLGRAEGDEIPLALRIAVLARDAAYQGLIGGHEHARRVISERAGHAFDPHVASAFVEGAEQVFEAAEAGDGVWDAVMDTEPRPRLTLQGDEIDRALAAVGDFADLLSPSMTGHSAGVSILAERAALQAGDIDPIAVRRAALIHDVGRVGVDPRIWNKPGPMNAEECEQVRLHAYHGERIFSRSPFLAELADLAGHHHERLDGSGYHRGAPAAHLSHAARLLAAADVFGALREPRPHRPAYSDDDAGRILVEHAERGHLDPGTVRAVLVASGQAAPAVERPDGLTVREAEVLTLIARGLQTKQVAGRLDLSPKTVDSHIQNAYRKIGVSTRAAATLYAMEHGLIHSGEFPISD